jgi:hypothetical protein
MMRLSSLPSLSVDRLCTLALGAALTGCGTYVEPKPGVYAGLGKTSSELTCEYATPTASRFTTLQCRRTADMPEEERRAQELLGNMRVHQPRDP